MPSLFFLPEEAPRLLRALASHDAPLHRRTLAALADTPPLPKASGPREDLVHVARAER